MDAIRKINTVSEVSVYSIGEEYINQVRTFGSLDYSPERIAQMLQLSKEQRDVLILRIGTPGDTYNTAFLNGRAIGQYNIDAELAKRAERGEIDAITMLQQRKDDRNHLDLRRDLLGY